LFEVVSQLVAGLGVGAAAAGVVEWSTHAAGSDRQPGDRVVQGLADPGPVTAAAEPVQVGVR